jgi:integrase
VGEPFLFCQPGGGGIWPSNLRRRFKRLLVDADLPDIKIHELRHTFAVLCLAGRVPLEAVSEALGHSRIETTKNIYAPHVPQLGHRAVNDLGRILETDSERRRLKAVPLPEEGVA